MDASVPVRDMGAPKGAQGIPCGFMQVLLQISFT